MIGLFHLSIYEQILNMLQGNSTSKERDLNSTFSTGLLNASFEERVSKFLHRVKDDDASDLLF